MTPDQDHKPLREAVQRLEVLHGQTQAKVDAQAIDLEAVSRVLDEWDAVDRGLMDMMNNAPMGIHCADLSSKVIIWANRTLLNALGYEWGEMVGHPSARFYEDPASVHAYDDRVRDIRIPTDSLLCRMKAKNGDLVPVRMLANHSFLSQLPIIRRFTRFLGSNE